METDADLEQITRNLELYPLRATGQPVCCLQF